MAQTSGIGIVRHSPADIADALERGVRERAAALDLEQAVRGVDACDEVALHPLLAAALQDAGWGVFREQRYPADRRRRRETEGERCDLVLTPDGRVLRPGEARETLFDPPDAVDPEDALWLEVKVVAQFTEEGANGNYASQLLQAVRHDVTKLAKDAGILHAALLIVLFVRERAVADHDLRIWQDKCLDRGLTIGAPSVRCVEITDRLGNGACVLAVYPVHRY